jgi:pectate lyase
VSSTYITISNNYFTDHDKVSLHISWAHNLP